ncbi:CWF19-like protein 2 [Frankliniella fusca]|uniref:CWF19-like protein 2 n=1 Tax=Frankliniella fusca TaxID=407009 RepID=A0AAE1LUV3_9NEOP|nr:CWF19-like protein 2 [Frankliniella fusca]
MRTRTKGGMVRWLIGSEETCITGSKLPSKRQVLRFFMYQHRHEGKKIRESATLTAREVLPFWERATIPTKLLKHIIPKIESLYDAYVRLKKNRVRVTSDTQAENENEFKA